MDSEDIRTKIREVLSQHAGLSQEIDRLGDDADLFAAGMTSFSSVNVMFALEEAFDVEFPDNMLKRGLFESVDSIASALALIATTA